MSWARIDDAFDDHPKVLAVLEHDQGGAAIGLWTLCLTWAYRNTLKRGKEPGRLPAHLPRRYLGPAARELAALLVKEGLWEALGEGDGWQIHDFEHYLATPKTREARAEAGRKGAAARWGDRAGKSAGPDGKLPSGHNNLPPGDGKPMAADGRTGPEVPQHGGSAPDASNPPSSDGNESSSHGNLPSGLPFEDGKPMASDGSRAPARRAIPNGIASRDPSPVPPTAGAVEPARQRKPPPSDAHVGTVVGAFVDGATAAGLKSPSTAIKARVGKAARQLLAQGYDVTDLIESAARMGASEYDDLDKQVRIDDARAKSATTRGAAGASSTAAQRAQQAINAGEELQRMIDEGRYPG